MVKKETDRKPQITFTVTENLKLAYEAATRIGGLAATRLCAAGFLFMLENPNIRQDALDRLDAFELAEGAPRSPDQVAEYVRLLSRLAERSVELRLEKPPQLPAPQDRRPPKGKRRQAGGGPQ